jgi:hypothetical protein
VHTGIGPAGTLHFDVDAEDLFGRLPQLTHHGPGIFLFLPAAIARTVIFENCLESRHRLPRSSMVKCDIFFSGAMG